MHNGGGNLEAVFLCLRFFDTVFHFLSFKDHRLWTSAVREKEDPAQTVCHLEFIISTFSVRSFQINASEFTLARAHFHLLL